MRTSALLLTAGIALAASGCAAHPVERHFRAGEMAEVARRFEADSSLHRNPAALYRAGLAHALPESPVFDPERALVLFDRLQALQPDHPQRERIAQLRQFLRLSGLQQERQLSRDARLRAQQAEIDDLRAQLARERSRADRLDREARDRDARIRALQEELDALKRIDLNRPAPGAAPRPPRR
jgi:hypothetical protein